MWNHTNPLIDGSPFSLVFTKKKGSTKGNPQQLFTQAIKDGIWTQDISSLLSFVLALLAL
jgi:hypothetical protein